MNIVENALPSRAINEVLFHGSSNSFDQFEAGHSNGWSNARQGFYFTDDQDAAKEFFGKVTTWHVNMHNAADFEHGKGSEIVRRAIETMPVLQKDLEAIRTAYGQDHEDNFLASRFASRGYLQSNEFIAALRKLGYDGMIFDDVMSQTPFTSYVAFDPSSATKVQSNA